MGLPPLWPWTKQQRDHSMIADRAATGKNKIEGQEPVQPHFIFNALL